MTTKKIIYDPQEFESIFKHFSSYTNSEFRKKVCDALDKKAFALIDPSTDPKKSKWNGLITIHFPKPPAAKEIIEFLRSRPNEFDMSDDKTLNLWWD